MFLEKNIIIKNKEKRKNISWYNIMISRWGLMFFILQFDDFSTQFDDFSVQCDDFSVLNDDFSVHYDDFSVNMMISRYNMMIYFSVQFDDFFGTTLWFLRTIWFFFVQKICLFFDIM
jgi:hypothetical protein